MTQPITVLIVEDSPQAQSLLVPMLESEADIKVAGVVESAEEAFNFIAKFKPDVIALDIQLPGMDCLAFTQKIMEEEPIPIICVTASTEMSDTAYAFDLLEAGALAIIEKPVGPGHAEFDQALERLTQTVKTMADVKLVRRRAVKPRAKSVVTGERYTTMNDREVYFQLIAIGASTGGPAVLQSILRRIPRDFPVPILVAQHIAPGFLDGFIEWLSATSRYPVALACHNQVLEPGRAYICPEGLQTAVTAERRIRLSEDEPMHGIRPSVSYLFQSVAQSLGSNAVGVLLSGMGKDGSAELKMIRDRGGATIAQDAASSVVHGMPGEAIKLGAAGHVVHADRIASLLVKLVTEGERIHAGRGIAD